MLNISARNVGSLSSQVVVVIVGECQQNIAYLFSLGMVVI